MLSFSTRIAYAFRCFFALIFSGAIPDDVLRALQVDPPKAAPTAAPMPEKPAVAGPERAIQILALFQRDGRLIDFLQEDVAPYPDSQLGAAVREIHSSCKQVLDRYVKLEPVLNSEEDQPVTLPNGVDSASIKLIGNVGAGTPTKGILRHRGWRVKEASLPSLPQGTGRTIVAPAEVEIP